MEKTNISVSERPNPESRRESDSEVVETTEDQNDVEEAKRPQAPGDQKKWSKTPVEMF